MEKVIDYYSQSRQMGDLLQAENVSIRKDFSVAEREKLQKKLEEYMKSRKNEILKIDLKKFILVIKGVDEASYLYQYVK